MKYDEEKLWRVVVTGAIQDLLGESKKPKEEMGKLRVFCSGL